jgi:hypothetical protein
VEDEELQEVSEEEKRERRARIIREEKENMKLSMGAPPVESPRSLSPDAESPRSSTPEAPDSTCRLPTMKALRRADYEKAQEVEEEEDDTREATRGWRRTKLAVISDDDEPASKSVNEVIL